MWLPHRKGSAQSLYDLYESPKREVWPTACRPEDEPIVTNGSGRAVAMRDGWTIRTADRTLAAHYEHTLVITRDEPILLTV